MIKPPIIALLLVVVALWSGLIWVLGDLRESRALNQAQATAIDDLYNDIRSLTAERNEASAIAQKLLGITVSDQ